MVACVDCAGIFFTARFIGRSFHLKNDPIDSSLILSGTIADRFWLCMQRRSLSTALDIMTATRTRRRKRLPVQFHLFILLIPRVKL